MGKIKIVSSMALDAICFIDQYNCLDADSNILEEQMNFIEKIQSLCPEKLKNGSLSMSALSMALTAYAEGDDFENYTLNDLAEFFKNAEQVRDVVKSKEMSEFLASHIHPMLDGLVDEWAEKYLGYINIFKEINFDKLWESDFLPIIQEEIAKNETIAQNINVDGMFEDMEKLKQCEPFGDVKIYISPMSFPVSFKLHGSSFLQAARTNVSAGLIAHELMHGFMNEKLEKLYLDYINSIKYLKEQHNRLINEQRSGNEEEFVMRITS